MPIVMPAVMKVCHRPPRPPGRIEIRDTATHPGRHPDPKRDLEASLHQFSDRHMVGSRVRMPTKAECDLTATCVTDSRLDPSEPLACRLAAMVEAVMRAAIIQAVLIHAATQVRRRIRALGLRCLRRIHPTRPMVVCMDRTGECHRRTWHPPEFYENSAIAPGRGYAVSLARGFCGTTLRVVNSPRGARCHNHEPAVLARKRASATAILAH